MGNSLRNKEVTGRGEQTGKFVPTATGRYVVKDIKTTAAVGKKTSSAGISQSTAGDNHGHKMTVEDFEILKVLVKGGFGKVMLVRKKDDPTNSVYAMKSLKKELLLKRTNKDKEIAHIETERLVLQNVNSQFVVHLFYAFQTPHKLYMVMDYMAGGELFHWLKLQKRFKESRCRLYIAELSLGLDALHQKNIIHRDLKTENILLDAGGHIRIADFGLAKGGITGYCEEGGTRTMCGTYEYMAPEIVDNKTYGKAVDWWALGTLLFEFLYGLPPFYDSNVQRMYHKILHNPLVFPKTSEKNQLDVSEHAKSIMRHLLDKNPSNRLCSKNGVEELKSCKFFDNLEFNRVANLDYKPEFIPPAAKNESDVGNFDKDFTDLIPVDSLVTSHLTDTQIEATNFQGFTYEGDKM